MGDTIFPDTKNAAFPGAWILGASSKLDQFPLRDARMTIQMDDVIGAMLSIGARIAIAALVLLVGYILARLMQRVAQRLMDRPQIASALGPSMARLLKSVVYYLMLALAASLGLIVLGVPATYILAVAVLLVLVLAVALQQSVANLAATVNFLMFQPFTRGELVETMGWLGTVREILLFNTVLLLNDQRLVSLPNSKIQESGVVNYTRMGRIWADFSLTVDYREDLDRVRALISEIAASDTRILSDPPFDIFVDDLGENGVRLQVHPTVAPAHYWAVRNDLRGQIKARFDAEGIRFALPQRDVRLAAAVASDEREGREPALDDWRADRQIDVTSADHGESHE
jgi:small conductance mechanosensitive channel